MQVGILGGTFDPPHVGHLLVAIDALERLPLDRLVVVPAAAQPLKGGPEAGAAHRLAMCRACFAGVPGIAVDPIEVDRGGLSYMVDTAEALGRRWPGASWHLLVGEDVVPTLPRWRAVDRLLSLVRLVVVPRPIPGGAVPGAVPGAVAAAAAGEGVRRLPGRVVDVSSTEVRARVRAGRPIRGFVTDGVAAYIEQHGLYQRDPAASAGPPRP